MNSHTFIKFPGRELKSNSSFNTALFRSGKTTPPLVKIESLIVEAKNFNLKKTTQYIKTPLELDKHFNEYYTHEPKFSLQT